jgi:hypothetical protein
MKVLIHIGVIVLCVQWAAAFLVFLIVMLGAMAEDRLDAGAAGNRFHHEGFTTFYVASEGHEDESNRQGCFRRRRGFRRRAARFGGQVGGQARFAGSQNNIRAARFAGCLTLRKGINESKNETQYARTI